MIGDTTPSARFSARLSMVGPPAGGGVHPVDVASDQAADRLPRRRQVPGRGRALDRAAVRQ